MKNSLQELKSFIYEENTYKIGDTIKLKSTIDNVFYIGKILSIFNDKDIIKFRCNLFYSDDTMNLLISNNDNEVYLYNISYYMVV